MSDWSDPFSGAADWSTPTPLSVAPTPAAAATDLRGRRVLVGWPGLGWRGDLRGDDPVVRGARTFVPVLPEADWYRAEAEQVEVFAPLVPVERVWVETWAAPADEVSRLVSLDGPACRGPAPVLDAGPLTGRRVVALVDGVEQRDLRAVTELHAGADDEVCVRVADELDWYRWAWGGQPPTTRPLPVWALWAE
ncbi:hypothetical protein [Pilimelia columellifera]|uniref:Uncharacterized protein n=1 Tax=Pilimelia columellifera subsp. columellifera TaxID=706583 RepID=A0ABN3NCH4_9ACTN